MSDDHSDVLCLRSYLDAEGYRPLPYETWPFGVVGAYVNGEGDEVVMIRNPLRGLELRPLQRRAAA
jgi:hypothetical protein